MCRGLGELYLLTSSPPIDAIVEEFARASSRLLTCLEMLREVQLTGARERDGWSKQDVSCSVVVDEDWRRSMGKTMIR